MNFSKLDSYLLTLMGSYGLSGFDCKVMQNHKVVYRKMCGHSNYAHTIPVSADDLYDIYSCTKVITMVAMMQLVEQGVVQLDDVVEKYIPAFSNMKMVHDFFGFSFPMKWPTLQDEAVNSPTKITIRQLMSMTSGLSYDITSQAIANILQETNHQANTQQITKAIAQMPLLFEPGTQYLYSLGHDVVAAVIEVATGKRYQDYLQEAIFNPLQLKNMYLHIPTAEKSRISAQYKVDFETQKIAKADSGNPYRFTCEYDSGGAGIACTVDDYCMVLDALACGGVSYNGHVLLTKASIDEMRKPQLNSTAQKEFLKSGKIGYSYGLGVRTLIDQTHAKSPIGEFGWDGAAGAYALVDPLNHISVFYAQEVLGMIKSYHEIHPTIRDLVFEALETL